MSILPDIKSPPHTPDMWPPVTRLNVGRSASAPTLAVSATGRAAFLDRQFQHSSIEARRNLSLLQKKFIKEGRDTDDAEFWGARGKEGFRMYLERKCGSVISGWRHLDRDKSGRLSFYEFCNGCRGMGYHGHLKKLWSELDTTGSGFISIMELDPEVGHYVNTFKRALLRKYGDMVTAWQQGIDIKNAGRVEEQEIAAAVENLGLTELDPKKLFKMLVNAHKGMGLTLAEFHPDASIGLANDNRHTQVGEDSSQAGLQTVDDFKKVLIQRCGSLCAAWRGFLDLDGNGRLTFGEFCQAVRRLGVCGDIKGVWNKLLGQLDQKGSGFLVFAQLDPDTDAAICEMRQKFIEVHGNMLLAWLKALDVKGTGMVSEQQFTKACVEAGFSKNARQLFRTLQPNMNSGYMTIKDFDSRAYKALSRGDFRMISESDSPAYGGKKPLELTFDQRQEAMYFHQVRKSWEAARREEFAKACRADLPQRLIDSPEEFKDLCVRKFGSITAAWRMCLDQDANGKLTFNEFCQALRRLGYAGDFKALWKHYDVDKNGHISLQEIDREGHEQIESFLQLLSAKYGDLDAAWKFGFHKDPHDSIDMQELEEACIALGYAHDVGQLFKNLQPMPGRMLLTIWDIDPECTRKRLRGQVPYVSEGKDLTTKTGDDTKRGAIAGSLQQQMRQVLRIRHGSTAAAWRAVLDPRMQGFVACNKFLNVMDEYAYSGNVKKLWEELAGGRAFATFKDIDPEAFTTLTHVRECLLDKFGNLTKAFDEGLDLDGIGRVDEAEFSKASEALGMGPKTSKKCFRQLLARHGQRSITHEDLKVLLIGVPTDQVAAVWAGSMQEPLAQAPTSTPSSPGQSLHSCRPTAPKVLLDVASPRAQAEKVGSEHHARDMAIKSLDHFKQNLIVKYGSIFAAWRHGLDIDQNGLITQSDFAKACQSLGVKCVQKLWAELDVNKCGQISLKELDPEVAGMFAELERLILENFPSTREGWKKTFDPTNMLRCDLHVFQNGCIHLGFKGKGFGSAERLFKLLRPEPGRSYLAYEDLWVNKDPNA